MYFLLFVVICFQTHFYTFNFYYLVIQFIQTIQNIYLGNAFIFDNESEPEGMIMKVAHFQIWYCFICINFPL